MPSSPDDAALLAQFAGQAMQALLTKLGPYEDDASAPGAQCGSEQVYDVDRLAKYAYAQAEAMLREHRRRTTAAEPVSESSRTEPAIPLSVVSEIIERALEIQKDPQEMAAAERLAKSLVDAVQRASSDGQERGNG